ncbi:MOXD1 homolog 2 [Copidosoma floridanum]|uniref:MOXD1 homolog 2 n=1 Tax=Copidosoma floridanum TaxID=29053 RepID=UPI0006C9A967|nr:MOXD1 homolog 2 [Copidosoma floridanum]XP_014208599.1 MOXD1 homolog 2 [Copidosoma floridanum]
MAVTTRKSIKEGPVAAMVLALVLVTQSVRAIEWKHSAVLDNNFLMLWTPTETEVIFEVQVKTPGYVGFGFTRDDGREGVDMVIGWVDNNGQVHLQDRHVKGANRDPQMDSSQDYHLQSGYENKTHTVLRFSRRYDTCDPRDLKITNDTLQVVWQYHVDEPASAAGVLPSEGAVRGTRPLYLVQLDVQPRRSVSRPIAGIISPAMGDSGSKKQEPEPVLHVWDLFNEQVRLPMDQDTLLQCRVFTLPKILRKHHVVRYEPVIQPGNEYYLHHMTLYECRGNETKLKEAKRTNGSSCSSVDWLHAQCNTIAATWSLGSEGFNYPAEAGYALNGYDGPRYYMLETHYSNPQLDSFVTDNSGLRLYHTDKLRTHDAGVLSIGIDPNWRHIIPPGQPEVISEGHCISRCTGEMLPDKGVNVFGVVMHTHQLGKKARLRQIRDGKELAPIAADSSYDPNYQEFRRLQRPVKVMPGDHLIAECTYSSRTRQTITLGGVTTKEETCLVSALYYPRIDLSLCYSLPALRTVLHSLGIEELEGASPLRIKSPVELKGMTLEERLMTYDWQTNFQVFAEATHRGSFKPLCSSPKGTIETAVEAHYPRIIFPYVEPTVPCIREQKQHNNWSIRLYKDRDIGGTEADETNSVERGQLVRNKVLRSSDGSSLATGSAARCAPVVLVLAILAMALR